MTSRSKPGALHVTSVDAIAATLRDAFSGGTVIAWRDVLHEGPIPAALNDQLASTRASFLASCGWGGADALRQELHERDCLLPAALTLAPEPFSLTESGKRILRGETNLMEENGIDAGLAAFIFRHTRVRRLRS